MNGSVYVPDDYPTPYAAYEAGEKYISVRTGEYDDTAVGEIKLDRKVRITSAGPGELPVWKIKGPITGRNEAQVDHMCISL